VSKDEDWKSYLTEEDKKILSYLLNVTRKYKYAYEQSSDVKIAQLWTALIEIQKQLEQMNKLLGKLEEPFRAIIEVGEAEKRKTIERLISEIVKPTDEETQEATKKLVDSLMKF